MLWYQVAIVFLVAFAVTFVTVPLSKRIAYKLGAVDYPSDRRINKKPMPRCGGIALYLGFCAGMLVIYVGGACFGWADADLYTINDIDFPVVFIGISLMFALGLIDDIIQLKAFPKFGVQILAAFIVALGGITIGTVRAPFGGDFIPLGYLDIPATVIYLVVFVNITNLIDGLDGLASGLIAIVAASLLFLCVTRGAYMLVLACVALIAVCLAFLKYNFPPASLFMGDSGSHFLGLMVGIISVTGVVRTQGAVVMLVPLVFAGVPVLDTFSAIVRRTRQHKPVGRGDLGHIHHRLMRSGLGQKGAVFAIWGMTTVLAVAGCAMESFAGPVRIALVVGLAVLVAVLIGRLGLFHPVLRHHYDNRGKSGVRRPSAEER